MAKSLGRDCVLSINAVKVASIRTKSMTINNAPVDVTDDDSATWRELWAVPGQKSIELSGAGLLYNSTNFAIAMQTNTVVEDCTLTFAGGTLSGNFFITSFSVTGEYNNASTFEVKLQSIGSCTFS
jgi:TP901-1 family phage major tail protein